MWPCGWLKKDVCFGAVRRGSHRGASSISLTEPGGGRRTGHLRPFIFIVVVKNAAGAVGQRIEFRCLIFDCGVGCGKIAGGPGYGAP